MIIHAKMQQVLINLKVVDFALKLGQPNKKGPFIRRKTCRRNEFPKVTDEILKCIFTKSIPIFLLREMK